MLILDTEIVSCTEARRIRDETNILPPFCVMKGFVTDQNFRLIPTRKAEILVIGFVIVVAPFSLTV